MSNSKKQKQDAAISQSAGAAQEEKDKAAKLQTELTQRRDIVGSSLPADLAAARTGAADIRATGGYTAPTKEDLDSRGYGGYKDFAETGGFKPGEKENFLRRATAPVAAVYSRGQDELNRRKTIQGGYMPGFDASTAKITRQAANVGAEANLNANNDFETQVRAGKVEGLRGMGTTVSNAESNAQSTARNKIAGQDLLQRYAQMGVAALSDIDQTELRNRLQSGQMSQADAQLLTMLAAQEKTTFEKIMQGIQVGAGAVSGIATAVNG